MKLSFLTYNVLFNKAFIQLEKILVKHSPDILCLQEVDTSDSNLNKLEKFGYRLADYSNSFIRLGNVYGVATYYKKDQFKFIYSDSLQISANLTEYFFTLIQTLIRQNKPKTVLRTDFMHKQSHNKITVCNAHMIVVAPNSVRTNHLNKALKLLEIDAKTKLIVGGDFNYLPYGRKRLEQVMKNYGMIEATRNIQQTFDIFSSSKEKDGLNAIARFGLKLIDRIFSHQMKNDYIFYRGLKLVKTVRAEFDYSDHYPIISTFTIK